MVSHCSSQHGQNLEFLVYICPMGLIIVFPFYRESDRSREVQLKAIQVSQAFMSEFNCNEIFFVEHFSYSISFYNRLKLWLWDMQGFYRIIYLPALLSTIV